MYNEILEILNLITQSYASDTGRPNCFAKMEDLSLLSSGNMGKLYGDYENGHFWARDWEAGGALRDNLKTEYPMVFVEMKSINYPNGLKKGGSYELYIVCLDFYNCPECSDTKSIVSMRMKDTLQAIVLEFFKFKQYDIIDDGIQWKGWYTTEQIEQFDFDYHNECGVEMSDFCDEPMEFSEWGESMGDKIGWATKLDVCGCESPNVQFDYTEKQFKKLGVTTCKNC